MTVRFAFVFLAFALTLLLPPAARAEPALDGSLGAATNRYFDAVAGGKWSALANGTSSTFHVIFPDGKRLSAGEFFSRLSEHYLISSTPIGNVKIGPSTISDGSALETVETNSWDYAMVGTPHGPVLERDWAVHQMTWIKSANGAWLLDEDRLTSATHTPYTPDAP
jgi:hypothetical protein